MCFEFIEEAMNTDLFIGFMERLIADSSQNVFLILDNLKVHHAKLVMLGWPSGKIRSKTSISRRTRPRSIPTST